ncbi:MAG TPA: rhomboid family intramembrane serine protease [Bacteroidales bacterium]|nr:rhomboid family intramembrane serine protease [Bacteroidales bacterium]HRW83809.1 rhomboid family intramembrane serine protease [Bacteroidales bacterium]
MNDDDSDISSEGAYYRKKFFLSILIPSIFVSLMWLVKAVEVLFDLDLSVFGIYPLRAAGIPGIITSPFVHSDLKHLFNNSLPLLLLAVALFFFYSEVALKVFSLTYFLTGLLVWLGGRSAWHIGASGLVYGLASFLFFSGIIRKYYRLIALSLLIVFLYGEMVWGIFPGVYQNVSWESHMLGVFSGILLAVLFRKEGPQAPVHIWPDEEEEGPGPEEEDRRIS